MADWFIPAMSWLGHYDGWISYANAERLLQIDDVPLLQFQVGLERLAGRTRRPNDSDVAHVLSQLDCLTWRAAADCPTSGRAGEWDSTQEPFSRLLRRGPVRVWRQSTPSPRRDRIYSWLLDRHDGRVRICGRTEERPV